MFQITLVFDHEEERLETATALDTSDGKRVILEAGTEITGTVYVDLTKTVIGSYVSVEFFRNEVSTLVHHGKRKKKHVLLKKLRLGTTENCWEKGYMKPGNYRIPFHIDLPENMVPCSTVTDPQKIASAWNNNVDTATKSKLTKRPKAIQYMVKLRFPGDSTLKPKLVKEYNVHIAPSSHPTLPTFS